MKNTATNETASACQKSGNGTIWKFGNRWKWSHPDGSQGSEDTYDDCVAEIEIIDCAGPKSGFTPGPWIAEGLSVYAPAPANVRPHVAKVIYGGAEDARLIAAAPELLFAAEKAMQLLVDRKLDSGQTGLILHAAIAKARGEA